MASERAAAPLTIRGPASPDDMRPPRRQRPAIDTEAGRAVAADPEIGAMSDAQLVAGIDELRRRRDAVILAHNYQIPPIQDLADFVGDSLQLSRQAAATDSPLIVFCGVHFMAETAAILSPQKRVLLPDPAAGCSLAASVTADQVREWRREHPDAVVVAYVNTDADVKAEADYCCTSANAVNVVRSIPEDREVLFLPDLFLGLYIEKMAGRRMHLWLGECHVHAGIRSEDVSELMARYPEADLLLHPECGCISQCLFAVSEGELPADRTLVLSTGGMAEHARRCTKPVDLVGTEVGMLHRLRQENPAKAFIPLREDAVCEYMKTITLPKVYRALRDTVYEVRVPEEVARRARTAIDRMVATSA
ncbi:MAG TPA: quinolinate synthase NadA [Acidimicrobiales bacterium]|nr:quinolinate synthase NadA [Acidimicrobiales bacterium]